MNSVNSLSFSRLHIINKNHRRSWLSLVIWLKNIQSFSISPTDPLMLGCISVLMKIGATWTREPRGPAGYEGGRLSYYPLPSNRYEQYEKGFMPKMLLDFAGSAPQNLFIISVTIDCLSET